MLNCSFDYFFFRKVLLGLLSLNFFVLIGLRGCLWNMIKILIKGYYFFRFYKIKDFWILYLKGY